MSASEKHDQVEEAQGSRAEKVQLPEGAGHGSQRERARSETRTRKSAQTRQRVMEAATQLMVERGNTAFQMSEISDMCGMSKGALYYYFSDKDDLVNAIFETTTADLVGAVDASVAAAESSGDALIAICDEFAKRVGGGSSLPMAIIRELVQTREGTLPSDSMHVHHIISVIADLLDQAKEAGMVRQQADSRLAAAAVCGAFVFGSLGSAPGLDKEMDSSYTAEVLDLVIHGLGNESHDS